MSKYNEPIRVTDQHWDVDTQPLVSVSCRTFNHEKFIRDAIEGILMQKTTFPVELIIHDDASTDNTADIIREYESRYPHIIKPIYQTENQYSKNVKIGLKYIQPKVKGKYYATCEGDDYWNDPLKLQKQIDLFEKHGDSCTLSFHPVIIEDDEMNKMKSSTSNMGNKVSVINSFQIISNYIPTVSAMVRANVFLNYPEISNKVPFGDALLWSVVASKGYAIYHPEAMAVRRKHNDGAYSNLNIKSQLTKSIKTRELMLQSKELSNVHIYVKAYLIKLYKTYFRQNIGLKEKYQIIKRVNSLIFNSPSAVFWCTKISIQKQIRRAKRYGNRALNN